MHQHHRLDHPTTDKPPTSAAAETVHPRHHQPAPPRATAQRMARLAGRLTDRDRLLCRLLAEHRVLTTGQLADLAFPNTDTTEHRLVILHRLGVVDRFRPHRRHGSAPYHYVLGPAGAAALAAERGITVKQLGWRRDRLLGLATSQQLAHLVGVNGFFCALARTARQQPGAVLVAWWPAQRCAARWGRLVHPDAYGRWREEGVGEVDFFLEYDRGTEPTARLAGKLAGYADLGHATGIATPLLVWLPTSAREAAARRMLLHPGVRVATAVPLTPLGPAEAVWLPVGGAGPRRRLAALADAWYPPTPPSPHDHTGVAHEQVR
jgi:Replication-relaxation